jgi:hypothetical protein
MRLYRDVWSTKHKIQQITVFSISSDATSDKVHPVISKEKVKLSQYRPGQALQAVGG